MSILPYEKVHRAGCLAIFKGNQTPFFADAELLEFTEFLDHETAQSRYFVVLREGVLVACGGYGQFGGRMALTWGMVAREHHRCGIGTQLLLHRLDAIQSAFGGVPVHLDTTQHTEAFFARFGFETVAVKRDGYEPGLHCVSMRRPPILR